MKPDDIPTQLFIEIVGGSLVMAILTGLAWLGAYMDYRIDDPDKQRVFIGKHLKHILGFFIFSFVAAFLLLGWLTPQGSIALLSLEPTSSPTHSKSPIITPVRIAPAVRPKHTPTSTETPIPTCTPTLTGTPTPTETSTPTCTPTDTPTSTSTPSPCFCQVKTGPLDNRKEGHFGHLA
ncbi:MAG: hypothetical protein H8D43_01390 [Chloroflexi bacterium]|nr:hypothetical protein [Chloroflexota bacterium]